jgi:hypothetical protein
VVESSGLLNRRTVKNCTGGSNPPLSARSFDCNKLALRLYAHPAASPQEAGYQGFAKEIRPITKSLRSHYFS